MTLIEGDILLPVQGIFIKIKIASIGLIRYIIREDDPSPLRIDIHIQSRLYPIMH